MPLFFRFGKLFAVSGIAVVLVGPAACRDTTAPPERGEMTGTLARMIFNGSASATIMRIAGQDETLFVWGHRPAVEELVMLRIPFRRPGTAVPVPAAAAIVHTVGGDVRVDQYDGTGSVTITSFSEMDSTIGGEFAFSARATYGSAPPYGSSVAFTGGRFLAKYSVWNRP